MNRSKMQWQILEPFVVRPRLTIDGKCSVLCPHDRRISCTLDYRNEDTDMPSEICVAAAEETRYNY